MIALFVAAIFACIWYLPLFNKMGGTKIPKKNLIFAFLLGLIPAPLIASAFQILLAFGLKTLGITDLTRQLIVDMIGAGFFEELLKFFFASLVLKKCIDLRKADYMVLFGAVGVGFEFAESFLGTDNIIVSIVRGIFALHLFFQIYLGIHAYDNEKKTGKLFNIKFAFTTMLIHGAYDCSLELLLDVISNMETMSNVRFAWFLGLGIGVQIAAFVFILVIRRKAVKVAKESVLEKTV